MSLFDFLGYTFRKRLARNKEKGNFFETFTPAVSKKAAQSFRDKIHEIRTHGTLKDANEMANLINPVVRGWINYFGRYNQAEAKKVLRYVNETLIRWARRRYKRFKRCYWKAHHWLIQIFERCPNLYIHWSMGVSPRYK